MKPAPQDFRSQLRALDIPRRPPKPDTRPDRGHVEQPGEAPVTHGKSVSASQALVQLPPRRRLVMVRAPRPEPKPPLTSLESGIFKLETPTPAPPPPERETKETPLAVAPSAATRAELQENLDLAFPAPVLDVPDMKMKPEPAPSKAPSRGIKGKPIHTPEEQRAMASLYEPGVVTMQEIATQFGCSKSLVASYVARLEKEKREMKKKELTPEQREAFAIRVEDGGEDTKKIAKQAGVSLQAIYNWTARLRQKREAVRTNGHAPATEAVPTNGSTASAPPRMDGGLEAYIDALVERKVDARFQAMAKKFMGAG